MSHRRMWVDPLERRIHLAAQAYDWNSVTIKANGFINGIVYSPAAPSTVYIHTDMGGAYRWDQSAAKWQPLNDWSRWDDWSPQNLGVETMAVDPIDPLRVYMAAGTYNSPTAILRSTDGGRTWLRTDVSGISSNGNGSARNAGERMNVDPNLPNIIYYGTRDDGLWRSTDYGATWNNVAAFPTIGEDSGVGQDTGIVWTLFDKFSGSTGSATQRIYAGVVTVSGGLTRIYRSTNGGTTWEPLPGGQPTTANYFPQRAAISPDGSSLYLTYSFSTSYPGPYGISEGFVYKVSNPGAATPTWTDISPPVTYGFSAVAIDPVDSNTVYVGELNNYNPADRIWKSTTAGGNWTAIQPNNNRNDSSAAYASSLGVHWLGDLQIDPFNRDVAMFTTGYGLYRTTNLTSGNPSWSFFNEGFEQSAVLELSSPNNGAVNLLSAIGDRDGYRHTDFAQSPSIGRHGQNNGLARGTSDDIDTAWDNGSFVVRTVRSAPYVQHSNDNGVTWNWFSSTGSSGSTGGVNNIAISADGTKAVYEPGGTGRVRYATRNGTTWSSWTSTGITNHPANGAQIVAELVAGSRTFYAYAGTALSKSTDGGATWTVMTSAAPNNGNWIRAVPNQAGHLLMSRNGNGVWRSVDGGANWAQLGAGIATTANQVGVGAAKPGNTYPSIFIGGTVGGQVGFFRSDDQGATWTMISDLSNQFGYVTVIQGDPRVYGRLYVGSNGRGILYADLHELPPSLPAGWSSQDVGAITSTGSAGESGGAWEVIGSGAGIASNVDAFRFAYTSLNGDGTITARVTDVPLSAPGANSAKAGVMIRNSLDANSANAFVALTPGSVSGVLFQQRPTIGGATATVGSATTGVFPPYWVRLTRAGNTFTAFASADGANWVQLGLPQTIAMNANVFVGLASTASNANQLNQAKFENVSLSNPDVVAPTVISSTFEFETAQRIRVTFSEDVSASLTAADLAIEQIGGATISPTSIAYDSLTNTATFSFAQTLPDGNFIARLLAPNVEDAAGNSLSADHELPLFVLAGDANRDRAVNINDFSALAANFNTAGTFSDGDFNYSGTVEIGDFATLAAKFNQSLPAARSGGRVFDRTDSFAPNAECLDRSDRFRQRGLKLVTANSGVVHATRCFQIRHRHTLDGDAHPFRRRSSCDD